MSKILVGTCNWSDFEHFYPRGLKPNERLGYYSQLFPLVEVDSTFYRLMPTRNFELWAERTPDDFSFDVKAYRTLTKHGPEHRPGARHADMEPQLDPADEDFRAFKESIEPLRQAGKLRSVLFQFPPWFRENERNREYLAEVRDRFPDDIVSVEFRHRSWLDPEVRADTFKQLRDLGLAYVAVDQPQLGSGSIPPIAEVTSPALAAVRFHGRNYNTWYKKDSKSSTERFNYLYSENEIADWVPKIEQLADQVQEVHVLMNNNRGNYAIVNARDAMRLLGQPTLPLDIEPYPPPEPGAARQPRADAPKPQPEQEKLPL
jgi:uncharacterized protein YecE (DUF72 family)